MTQHGHLDPVDFKILGILQENSRMDTTQIAFKVHKSPTATTDRIRRLQEKGYIKRYTAVLDRQLMGRPTLMVAMVKLNSHAASNLGDFSGYMHSLPEIQVCLQLSGEYDFLLQVAVKDPSEYEHFLNIKLCGLTIVEKVQSALVLKECKLDGALPVCENKP